MFDTSVILNLHYFKRDSEAVMYIPKKNVKIVLPSFIAAAVVWRMLIISMERFMILMKSDVRCKGSG